MDTPGGDLDSMKAISQAILASPVPVAVYVTPAGGRAASISKRASAPRAGPAPS